MIFFLLFWQSSRDWSDLSFCYIRTWLLSIGPKRCVCRFKARKERRHVNESYVVFSCKVWFFLGDRLSSMGKRPGLSWHWVKCQWVCPGAGWAQVSTPTCILFAIIIVIVMNEMMTKKFGVGVLGFLNQCAAKGSTICCPIK